MGKFNNHELTNKIGNNIHPGSVCKTDTIIRQWLEERAGELDIHFMCHSYKTTVRKILGIEEVVEPWKIAPMPKVSSATEVNGWCPHVYESDCHGIEMIKDPLGKEWAIGGTDAHETGRWTHDPWCGLPIKNPTPKPLVERLADKLEHYLATENYGSAITKCNEMAQISLDFLREHKEEL